MPLEYAPRSGSVYSDLGFLLLGFLAADRGGSSLAVQFDDIRRRLASVVPKIGRDVLAFDLAAYSPAAFRNPARTAATQPLEDDPRRGRVLVGEVHDAYAAALGGVAGHAGLFGTASTVGAFAQLVLRAARGDPAIPGPLSPADVARTITRTLVPDSSRALGWDAMLPTSSCGQRMSRQAFGHVGFTGTSLWIDPTRDRYFVLLTNRACGGGTPDAMREVRRAFHDTLGEL
jgi:CubicO group peptidase (beta-lactamase class C family)